MLNVEHILLLAFKIYIFSKVFSYQYVLRNLNFCHNRNDIILSLEGSYIELQDYSLIPFLPPQKVS